MSCKCGANTLAEHRALIESGVQGGHVYSGFFWGPRRTVKEILEQADPWPAEQS